MFGVGRCARASSATLGMFLQQAFQSMPPAAGGGRRELNRFDCSRRPYASPQYRLRTRRAPQRLRQSPVKVSMLTERRQIQLETPRAPASSWDRSGEIPLS